MMLTIISSTPGSHPQAGKLVGTTADEVVIEVGNDGVRLHFPRIGYIVRAEQGREQNY